MTKKKNIVDEFNLAGMKNKLIDIGYHKSSSSDEIIRKNLEPIGVIKGVDGDYFSVIAHKGTDSQMPYLIKVNDVCHMDTAESNLYFTPDDTSSFQHHDNF